MGIRDHLLKCAAVILFLAAGTIYLFFGRSDEHVTEFEVRTSISITPFETIDDNILPEKNKEHPDSSKGHPESVTEEPAVPGSKTGALVNINTADEAALMTLPGIGSTRAAAIIEYREAAGGFGTIEDIMRVKGIKNGIFTKIKDMITVD